MENEKQVVHSSLLESCWILSHHSGVDPWHNGRTMKRLS